MAIDGTTRNNTYSDRELERLREHQDDTTRGAINQIGAHAGLTQTYLVRGDDKSEREIVLAHKTATRAEGPGIIAEQAADFAVEQAAEKVLGVEVSLITLPINVLKFGYEALKHIAEDNKVGHERAGALTKDAMHIVLMGNLNGLPKEYVENQLGRYTDSEKKSNLVQSMYRALGRGDDHQALLTMQLHCDQGMNAARGMCDANLDAKAFLASHPDAAKRCAEDPAFKAGFDGVAWAKQKGPAEYGAVVKELEGRDARYEGAHVAWRA